MVNKASPRNIRLKRCVNIKKIDQNWSHNIYLIVENQ